MLSQNISMVYYLQGPHCAEYCIWWKPGQWTLYTRFPFLPHRCPQAQHAWVNKYIILHLAHTQSQ